MMDESAAVQSHCGNLEALSLLGDVLSVLTEPSNKVIDDTCIEKLLSWLTKVASKSVTLQKLFHESADVVGFLQKTSTLTDPSTCKHLCDAPGLTFALKLAAILLNSLYLQLGIKSGTSSDEAVCIEGYDDVEEDTWKHYVDVISDLTKQLLVGAQQLSYWEQGSVRMAYFVASKAMIYHRCPSNVCQQADFLNTAFAALEDNSMFVVTAAQQFIAALIATSHSCVKRESARESLTGSVLQGTPSTREDGFTNTSLKETNKLWSEETSVTQKSALCATLISDCRVKRPLGTSGSFCLKRSKGNHQEESSNKRRNCDCKIFLETLLQNLTERLQMVKSIAPNAVDLHRHSKLWSVCVGVVRSLIETSPEKAQSVLSDMSLVSVISELLNSQGHIHPNMCHSVVDFVSVAVYIYLDSDIVMEDSSLRIMISFPWQLLDIHQFISSIQLASILHRALQHPKVNGNVWFERLRDETCSSLMDLVMLPLHCVLNHSKPSDCKLSAGRHALLQEMFSSKCQCSTILTHSLCALDNMLVQSQVMSNQSSIVDDGISILSVTLGQESQQTAVESLKGHLRGSLKVTKVILALLMNTVDSENKSEFKLTEVCLMRLILELTTILSNPESDCNVICKCLDSLASLLSNHTLILKDKIDCMRLLGDLMIKKSWDPHWEVRDSVIGFLKAMLISDADSLLPWFKLHHFHLRIFECINDGDNFVRASALAAMVDVSKKQDLWQDLLTRTGKSELALVGGLVNILLEDSQGFARRATICTLTEWLGVFPWLQTGLNCVSQDIKSCCNANGHGLEQASAAAARIRQGVSSAMFDLDWEVKLGALQFWETFINLYISRHGSLDTYQNKKDDEKGDVVSDSYCMSLFKLRQLLKQEDLITELGKVLDDEDRTVALKACQMLLSLQDLIQSHPLIQNKSSYLKSDESCLEEFIRKCLKELEKMSLQKTLEVKMKVVDGYEEHPVSLLEDILAVTQQKDANILDCY